MKKTAAVPKTTLAAPRRLAPRKYPKTPSAIPTAPADRFTLAPRMATTKPPVLKSSPIKQQILPNSSFSKPLRPSTRPVPSCCISSRLSSGPYVLGSGYLVYSRVRARKQSRLTLVFCAPSLPLRHSLRKGVDALLEKLG